jgi:hypothetical protein
MRELFIPLLVLAGLASCGGETIASLSDSRIPGDSGAASSDSGIYADSGGATDAEALLGDAPPSDAGEETTPAMIGCYWLRPQRCNFQSTTGRCRELYKEGACPSTTAPDPTGGALVGCCVSRGPTSVTPEDQAITAACYYGTPGPITCPKQEKQAGYTTTWQTTPPGP